MPSRPPCCSQQWVGEDPPPSRAFARESRFPPEPKAPAAARLGRHSDGSCDEPLAIRYEVRRFPRWSAKPPLSLPVGPLSPASPLLNGRKGSKSRTRFDRPGTLREQIKIGLDRFGLRGDAATPQNHDWTARGDGSSFPSVRGHAGKSPATESPISRARRARLRRSAGCMDRA